MSSDPGKQSLMTLYDLSTATVERAKNLGHRLGAWEELSEEGATARRTVCEACGRVAYVRIEGGLFGAAGGACTDRCPG